MVCEQCGKQFEAKWKGNRFCSLECSQEHMRQTRTTRQMQNCIVCGKPFLGESYRKSKYCSLECRNADWHNAHAVALGKCAEEKAKRDIEKERRKIAKRLIRVLKKEIQQKEKAAQPPVLLECAECGKVFISHNGTKYCTDSCRRRHRNRARERRIYRNGKPDLSISLTKLYMRDMGVCALCGRRIDFDGDSNGAHYPSIDHIIPLSKGGVHRWDNVQLACRECNNKKRDK